MSRPLSIQTPEEKIRNLVHLLEDDFQHNQPFYIRSFHYIQRRFSRSVEFDDIWQEVLSKLTDENSQAMKAYSGDVDPDVPLIRNKHLSSYITQCLIFKSIDSVRKRKKHPPTFSEWVYTNIGDEDPFSYIDKHIILENEHIWEQDYLDKVSMTLDNLTESDKSILYYRYFDVMDYNTIAQKLNIPVGTVRSRLFRAKERLKESIGR